MTFRSFDPNNSANTAVPSTCRPAIRRLAVLTVILLLLAAVVLQSACLPFSIRPKSSTNIDPSFTARTEASHQATSQQTAANEETTAAATRPATTANTSVAVSFEEKVAELILAGLQKKKQSISLDAAIEPNTIPAQDIQATIDLVFQIFRKVFCRHPEFFYLNGSINVSYTQQGNSKYLESMTVKPDYWDRMTGLSPTELNSLITQVDTAVSEIVSDIQKESDVPWRQLLLVHDYLIRTVAYDGSLDQDNNQVFSALIEKKTLCQGYAQSFQLIGQRLGFDIQMILGECEGVGHAWNIVKLDGKYYQVDVTYDDPTPDGGANQPIQHIYFMRSDSLMKENHQWSKPDYPACPEDGAQYYRRENLLADSQKTLKTKLRQFVAGIDFTKAQDNRLELLFTGSDLPSDIELEALVRTALNSEASEYSVLFSHQVSMRVIMVVITPDN